MAALALTSHNVHMHMLDLCQNLCLEIAASCNCCKQRVAHMLNRLMPSTPSSLVKAVQQARSIKPVMTHVYIQKMLPHYFYPFSGLIHIYKASFNRTFVWAPRPCTCCDHHLQAYASAMLRQMPRSQFIFKKTPLHDVQVSTEVQLLYGLSETTLCAST